MTKREFKTIVSIMNSRIVRRKSDYEEYKINENLITIEYRPYVGYSIVRYNQRIAKIIWNPDEY